MSTWTKVFKTLVESTREQDALLRENDRSMGMSIEREGHAVTITSPFITDAGRACLLSRGYTQA